MKTSKKQHRGNHERPTGQFFGGVEPLEARQLMSATTVAEISWNSPTGPQTVTYEIGSDHQVYENCGNGLLNCLGGQASQISAGLDNAGKPEVYAIGMPTQNVFVNSGNGWTDLGRQATQISGAVNGTVYAMGADKQVYMDNGSGWIGFGGQASQISAGENSAGQPEVYAIGVPSQHVFLNTGQGWVDLGGQATQISGAANDSVYAIGAGSAVYVERQTGVGGSGWNSLGGVASQISSGIDASGTTDVFAIGSPSSHAFINDGSGWVDFGSSATGIAAPAFGIAAPGNTFAITQTSGQNFVHNSLGIRALPLNEPTPLYQTDFKDFSSDPLFAAGGPSIDDVNQRSMPDCYYLADLSAIAEHDPALIKKDITQRSDGSYDVYIHSGGSVIDEHVDGYLPDDGETATLGTDNCTWVPIMEKAYAYFSSSQRNLPLGYNAIAGGNGGEAFPWDGVTSSVAQQGFSYNTITTDLNKNLAVVIDTNGAAGPLEGYHQYVIVNVRKAPTSGGELNPSIGYQYLVRNPWGVNYAASPTNPGGWAANQNGFDPTNDGYQWVSGAAITAQVGDLFAAAV